MAKPPVPPPEPRNGNSEKAKEDAYQKERQRLQDIAKGKYGKGR